MIGSILVATITLSEVYYCLFCVHTYVYMTIKLSYSLLWCVWLRTRRRRRRRRRRGRGRRGGDGH